VVWWSREKTCPVFFEFGVPFEIEKTGQVFVADGEGFEFEGKSPGFSWI
jgi:hypothetical protein